MTVPALFTAQPRDAAALQRVSDARLRRLVAHAWRQSDFHRQAWERAGLTPGDVSGARDLPRLPLLVRDSALEQLDALLDRDVDRASCVEVRTNGTTGKRLVLPSTSSEVAFAHALWVAGYTRHGVRPWHRQAKFFGMAGGAPKRRGFQKLGILRRDYFSVAAPTREKIRWLRETKPDVVFSWGSIFNELALALEESGETLSIPLAVSTSDPVMKDLATKRITRKLVEAYGSIESGPLGFACPLGRGYHIDTRWNIIELVNDAGEPAPAGRIVVTVLWRRTLPLIRYEIGDLGTWATEPCGCGNPMPLLASLDGRASDLVELPDGERVPLGAATIQLRGIPGIRQYQLVQTGPTDVIFHLVTAPDFPADGEQRFRQNLVNALGDRLRITIHRTGSIPQIPGQKVRAAISRQRLADLRAEGHDVSALIQT